MAKKQKTVQLNPETIAKINFSRGWHHKVYTEDYPEMNAFQTELDQLAAFGFSQMHGGVVLAWNQLTEEEKQKYFK